MVYLQITYELRFWGSIFWIFRIMYFFPRKYKYRFIRVYVWFKDDKHVIWMWIWLTLKKKSACSTEYEVCDSFASLTRQQTSYSGSAGWYFRYQSIHFQIAYAYEMVLRWSLFTNTFDSPTHHPVIYQLQIYVIM